MNFEDIRLVIAICVASLVGGVALVGIAYKLTQWYRRNRLIRILQTTQIYETPVTSSTQIGPEEQTATNRQVIEQIQEGSKHISDMEQTMDQSDFIRNVFTVDQHEKIPRRRKINKLPHSP